MGICNSRSATAGQPGHGCRSPVGSFSAWAGVLAGVLAGLPFWLAGTGQRRGCVALDWAAAATPHTPPKGAPAHNSPCNYAPLPKIGFAPQGRFQNEKKRVCASPGA